MYKSEKRLREAQKIAHMGNWELDLSTNALTWSKEIYRIFEIDPEQFGASYEAFLASIHPDDRGMVNAAYKQSLETREPYGLSHRLLMPDGRIKYVHERCETFYNPEGRPLCSVGTVQDITDWTNAKNESFQLRNELSHLSRSMTMSELSASLAHEINQPLGAILNNAVAAKILNSRIVEGDTTFEEILEDIISDATRAGEIIRRIRGITQKGMSIFEQLNVNNLIEDVLKLYQNNFILENISLILDLKPDLVPIRGDRVRLQQVLINLISNAIEAMKDIESKTIKILSTFQPTGTILVSVIDSGTGIDDAKKEKIFQPFFTTKSNGLGMGLRISRSIIEEHGGQIWMENNNGAGVTFSLSLKTNGDESK